MYWPDFLWKTYIKDLFIFLLFQFLLSSFIIIIIYSLEFFKSVLAEGFSMVLRDSKSSQVSRTRLRILAVLSIAVVCIVSTRQPTSKSSRPFNNPLFIVPNAPITIGTIVTFMFHNFFNSLARSSTYPSFHFPSDLFCDPLGQQSRQFCKCSFFLLIIIRSGLLAGIRRSVCMLKSHRSLCVSFSKTDAGLCIYYLLLWSNLSFLHISQWITLPTQSCLALYSFCANLLHSLIMWLIVSSLSPHSLHLLFFYCLIYSRFNMIGPYDVVLCYY